MVGFEACFVVVYCGVTGVYSVYLGSLDIQEMETEEMAGKRQHLSSSSESPSLKKACIESSNEKDEDSNKSSLPRVKLKMFVLLIAYSGKGYLGMQRNPGCKTIEHDLMQALLNSCHVTEQGAREPRRVWFQRAARTDKGVSACGQIVSIKLDPKTLSLDAINAHLPDQIRVLGAHLVTNRFDAKLQCDARTYSYMAPSFAFAPASCDPSENYRITDDVLEKVRDLLSRYKGTHKFFNFTTRRKADDSSNARYIMEMTCGDPFICDDLEFVTITVKGQSFMLHQIRMMVGLVVAIARGVADESVLNRALTEKRRLNLPRAPALGLVLEGVWYRGYNTRITTNGIAMYKCIDWSHVQSEVNTFKRDFIISQIADTERQEKSMLNWLSELHRFSFDVRIDYDNNGDDNAIIYSEKTEAIVTAAATDDASVLEDKTNGVTSVEVVESSLERTDMDQGFID